MAAPPDTIRVAFLRVDFLRDRGGAKSTGDGRFDLDPADTVADPVDRPPHDRTFYQDHGEALSRYYDAMSYGQVVVKVDVWPAEEDSAYHLPDMADLGPWKFGPDIFPVAVRMFRQMLFAADSQSIAKNDRIPWDRYDRFDIIHAGSDLQSDVKQDSPEDIPSFTIFVSDSDRVIFPDSSNRDRPIDRCSFIPETINQDGYYGADNGVIAHENGHNLFGFGDVYDVDSGFPVVGYWSLMDSGNLVGSRVELPSGEIFAVGLLPPSVDPFQRNFIGPGTRIVVPTFGDTLALPDGERHDLFYKLPLSSDEYLLLENRFLTPSATVKLDQDSVTHVALGPKLPDRFEYDALLPGGGILVWHVDESVIPFETSLRTNPDFGFNSNPARFGLQVIEADGLDDLGDPGSPYLLGSPLDPYQLSVNPVLSDTTLPNLIPNQGTRPHARLEFLDDAQDTMHFVARRAWQLARFPVTTEFPPDGAAPLAIDADGDRNLEVCWAGGDTASADSAALFAVRADGKGIVDTSLFTFAHLDHRPLPVMAALVTGDPQLDLGPALFAAVTQRYGPADTLGGRVWLVDATGAPQPGFPVRLASPATTPPLVAGAFPTFRIYVGCDDGRVRGLDPTGAVVESSAVALAGGVRGRLAYWFEGVSAGLPAAPTGLLAAGGAQGDVAVFAAGTGLAAAGP
ncbi:MAG TPA: immune inhibitor A domain-containing protein, partial [Candidatus Eisenbacteria bacterium]|nr:immune inhibitor A domain-containing protein [Candidatus Eisenbacteria bacterium]